MREGKSPLSVSLAVVVFSFKSGFPSSYWSKFDTPKIPDRPLGPLAWLKWCLSLYIQTDIVFKVNLFCA